MKPDTDQIMKEALEISGRTIPGGWVVGGKSRLMDVWSASALVLRAPAISYPDHSVVFTLGEGVSEAMSVGKKAKLREKIGLGAKKTIRMDDSKVFFDCRFDATGNVAHILQNQIGVALAGLEVMGMSDRWRDLVFVVSEETPGYAAKLFEAMGFEVLASSDMGVSGTRLTMEPKKFPLRAVASKYLRRHAIEVGLLSDDDPVGEDLFLSRRARRTVTNMGEIEPRVKAAGYRTVYAEDYSAREQIQMIARAGRVFALHGAAMGFLMFRDPARHGAVVECFPCGYATGWAKAICWHGGDIWFGAQGDLESQVVADVLGDGRARDHEADDYRLEPRAVDALLKASAMVCEQGKNIEAEAFEAMVGSIEIDVEPTSGEGGGA
jgi:glycosyl transferase family 61